MGLNAGVLKLCIEEAEKSKYRFRLGSVIFKGNRVISSGHNYLRSCSGINSRYRKWANSLHAEVDAVINAGDSEKLKNASILIMKISKTDGNISNAEPCSWCKLLIKNSGIKNIYYSNKDGEISCIKAKEIELTKSDFIRGDNLIMSEEI